ncbi:N-acyl-L-homoserine lactone synthetase [Bradyrhizobium diazoefficiens]|jgi:acyl homoserine lactone synthase|uniref:acyl-homoserine-lactone synthase n=1 Tax=Bradyrhizobium TaxID=374 RepID=UPI000554D6C3|nr:MULTISPECIES: acyl-homoserine-lactone synthase [Bradyrhizobium]WLB05113.1 acyl-homoserine-lactone synthase [Bradyrhizobium elkanii]
MRAIAVPPKTDSHSAVLLDSMHRLRARVFCERMNWDVEVRDGREADRFRWPTYILALSDRSEAAGCARLLPATGPTLLSVRFPELIGLDLFKPHAAMIESSRFCVDTSIETGRAGQALHDATWTLFAAIIEWSMADGYSELVTVTDVCIERILRRAGWPMARIGEPKPIGNTTAVVGPLPTDQASFERGRLNDDASSIYPLPQAV